MQATKAKSEKGKSSQLNHRIAGIKEPAIGTPNRILKRCLSLLTEELDDEELKALTVRAEEYTGNKGFRDLKKVSDFIVARAKKEDKKEVIRMMEEVFFKTDPSSCYSKVSEVQKVSQPLQEITVETLNQNLSFVAKSHEKDSKIFGVAINGVRPTVLKPNLYESLFNQVPSKSEKILLELWQFVASMPPESEKYFGQEKEVFETCYLAVDPLYRNRKIASELVLKSKKEAADRGVKYMRIDCTSFFTAKIAAKVGLKCLYELNYLDYMNSIGEKVFLSVVHPHTKIAVYGGKSS